MDQELQPVFRFAPSPNGYLHLGHAYSALLNQKLAHETGGRLLLRIEDIDTIRCRPELVAAVEEDLRWLGLKWEAPTLRQSTQFNRYSAVLSDLEQRGLIYPCFCTRKQITEAAKAREAAGVAVPRDPDQVPLYNGACRKISAQMRAQRRDNGDPFALRLDMEKALVTVDRQSLSWKEAGIGWVSADPKSWGDVVMGRKEMPTSYHLSVVLDDAMQGVSHIVRGRDLYAATSVHCLLQALFNLPAPIYRHHDLVVDASGQKLAKSKFSTPIRQLKAEGVAAATIRAGLGFDPE